MSSLFSMLSAAGNHASNLKYEDPTNPYAKRRATMYAKTKLKWGTAFAELGGSAPTVKIGEKLGFSNATALNALIRLEERNWVRRSGRIPKKGRGPDQVVWEWIAP
jgi:hypothetical protein